jgi:hypothetical protein
MRFNWHGIRSNRGVGQFRAELSPEAAEQFNECLTLLEDVAKLSIPAFCVGCIKSSTKRHYWHRNEDMGRSSVSDHASTQHRHGECNGSSDPPAASPPGLCCMRPCCMRPAHPPRCPGGRQAAQSNERKDGWHDRCSSYSSYSYVSLRNEEPLLFTTCRVMHSASRPTPPTTPDVTP